MKKIVEYILCGYYDSPVPLQEEINLRLKEGWELYEGPVVMTSGTQEKQTVYAQAMVRYEEVEDALH